MTWLSLGSLALPHQFQRQGVTLRNEIARLGQELTTGVASSPQRHLRGDLGALSAIESRLARLDAYTQSTKLMATHVDATQVALTRMETTRGQTASRMLTTAASGPSDEALTSTGQSAAAALIDAVSALSTRSAGKALFSGAATDRAPLPDAATILSTITPLVSGASSAQDIADIVTAAFMNVGGPFEATLYQGAAASQGPSLGGDGGTQPTALDPAVRKTLSGLVIGSLLADPSIGLGRDQRQALARLSAESLMSAAAPMASLQASVGETQAALDRLQLQHATEGDALRMSRSDMIGVDPYDAATRLEEARVQLETLYTVTARTSRLSLTEYLR